MEQLLLTISILVSGEYEEVKKCLDSIQPLLEQVPSELILTDTGCTPKVRELMERYTDQIIDFTWCKDFSAARNVGLRVAKGKWFLYLDDDEWFDDTDDIARFLLSDESENYNVAYYTQRNYISRRDGISEDNSLHDAIIPTYQDHYVDRMIRMVPGLHFEHRVHEAYTGIKIGRKKRLNSYVHHYGYAYQNKEERLAKYNRNQELLKIECQEHPDDMRMWYQRAIASYSVEKWDDSIKVSETAIARKSDSYYWDALHINILYCLERQKKWEDIIARGEDYLQKKLFPYSQFGVYQYLIKAYWHMGNNEQVLAHGKKAIGIYVDHKKYPEDYDVNQTLDDSLWQPDRINRMLLLLIAAMIQEGDDSMAGILEKKDLRTELKALMLDQSYQYGVFQVIKEYCDTEEKIKVVEHLLLTDVECAEAFAKEFGKAEENFQRPYVELPNGIATKTTEDYLTFPRVFFDGEIRNGFYVEPFMKNAWASEIVALRTIGNICKENGLRYFADWGTLLGAVRHHGFIPWDDDIDICMPRKDLLCLLEIIEEQYPEWKVRDVYSDRKHGTQTIRIVNRLDLATQRDEIKDAYGFPLPTGIDIFALDTLPDDEQQRTELKEVQTLIGVAHHVRKGIDEQSFAEDGYFENIRLLQGLVTKIEEICHMKFSVAMPTDQELLILLDEVQGMYRDLPCNEVTEMTLFCDRNYSDPWMDYAEVIMMPFENIEIPVPIGYDRILRKKYGEDYMTPRQIGAGHDYPFYNKLLDAVCAENPERKPEEVKQEVIAISSGYYRRFLEKETKPYVTYSAVEKYHEEMWCVRAAESEIIAEIERLCSKNNLSVYGIGDSADIAQKEKQYPIDAQIHLGMVREDYEKLLEILPKELNPWFDFRDLYHTNNHDEQKLYIITDAYRANIEEYLQRFHGCNAIVGIDISPMDAVSDNYDQEKARETLYENLVTTARAIPLQGPYTNEILGLVEELHSIVDVKMDERHNLRCEFYKLADRVAGSYRDEESEKVKAFSEDVSLNRWVYARKQLRESIDVMFGNVKVKVPKIDEGSM